MRRIFDFTGENRARMTNNYEWLGSMDLATFLRDFGKHIGVNYMLAKETVATRLETGISFTEFTYTLLQAIDFLHLYKEYGCKMQIGGSDQWGTLRQDLNLSAKWRERMPKPTV